MPRPGARNAAEATDMSDQSYPQDALGRYPDLAGKAAIVTGTSRGIGCAIAEVLAGQGMKLALAARSVEAGSAFAEKLRAAGAECLFVAADLATPEGARNVFEEARQCFGRIHLLVNNAANLRSRPFLQLDEQAYRDSFEANVRMMYGLSFLVAQQMAETGGGVIVHVSSVGGLRAHQGMAGYDASKGAVDALTRSMAVDLAPRGIRVNAVAPGAIDRVPATPRWEQLTGERAPRIPLGRLGDPHEIGHAVAFLASAAAAYVTGQVLYVDGGLTAQLTPPGMFV